MNVAECGQAQHKKDAQVEATRICKHIGICQQAYVHSINPKGTEWNSCWNSCLMAV